MGKIKKEDIINREYGTSAFPVYYRCDVSLTEENTEKIFSLLARAREFDSNVYIASYYSSTPSFNDGDWCTAYFYSGIGYICDEIWDLDDDFCEEISSNYDTDYTSETQKVLDFEADFEDLCKEVFGTNVYVVFVFNKDTQQWDVYAEDYYSY